MKLRYTSLSDEVKEVRIIKALSDHKWKVQTSDGIRYWYAAPSGCGLFVTKDNAAKSQRRISWYAPEVVGKPG